MIWSWPQMQSRELAAQSEKCSLVCCIASPGHEPGVPTMPRAFLRSDGRTWRSSQARGVARLLAVGA